jgi:hypothetical protein
MEMKLQPDRTRELAPQDQFGMWLGKVLVGVVFTVALGGGLVTLRVIERDAHRIAQKTPWGSVSVPSGGEREGGTAWAVFCGWARR